MFCLRIDSCIEGVFRLEGENSLNRFGLHFTESRACQKADDGWERAGDGEMKPEFSRFNLNVSLFSDRGRGGYLIYPIPDCESFEMEHFRLFKLYIRTVYVRFRLNRIEIFPRISAKWRIFNCVSNSLIDWTTSKANSCVRFWAISSKRKAVALVVSVFDYIDRENRTLNRA